MFLSFITGHFKNLFYFTLIIIVHELGHFITGKLVKFKIDKIEIYPYGGCSKMSYDINTSFFKEFFVLIMGPLIQIVFTFIVCIFNFDVPTYFYTYSLFILCFNLIPIYPLDGGRLLHLFLCLIVSYYNSLKFIIYISYFLFMIIFIYFIFLNWNLMCFLILILLGKQLIKEMKQIYYYFEKFLLERYLNDYSYLKVKIVKSINQMHRYCYHKFRYNNFLVNEKEMLNTLYKVNS